MFEKLHRKSLVATLSALTAALAVGGIAVAQDNGSSAAPSRTAAPAATVDTPESPSDKPDTDKHEAGDQGEVNDKETNDDATGKGDGDGETNDDAAAPAS